MPDQIAFEIVQQALVANDISGMLLGKSPYAYRPKWSPSNGKTDLTILLDTLYVGDFSLTLEEIRGHLIFALEHLVESYEGLIPVATCLLYETLRRSGGEVDLGLPVEKLARMLKDAIQTHHTQLTGDKTGEGAQWTDGKLGELRCLSKTCQEEGGPAFT